MRDCSLTGLQLSQYQLKSNDYSRQLNRTRDLSLLLKVQNVWFRNLYCFNTLLVFQCIGLNSLYDFFLENTLIIDQLNQVQQQLCICDSQEGTKNNRHLVLSWCLNRVVYSIKFIHIVISLSQSSNTKRNRQHSFTLLYLKYD